MAEQRSGGKLPEKGKGPGPKGAPVKPAPGKAMEKPAAKETGRKK